MISQLLFERFREGPRRYGVTTFIGTTLGNMWRAGILESKLGRGTGFFSYNHDFSYWARKPLVSPMRELQWADLAVSLGHDAGDWPLLDYREGSSA